MITLIRDKKMKNKKTKTIMELVERLIKKRKQNKEETIAWFIACS